MRSIIRSNLVLIVLSTNIAPGALEAAAQFVALETDVVSTCPEGSYFEQCSASNETAGADAAHLACGDAVTFMDCDCAAEDSCWTRHTLTGGRCGLRSCLQESGIAFQGRLTQFGFGVSGGINAPLLPSRFQGDNFDYTGNAQFDFIVDLEKYGGLEAGQLIVTAEQAPWGKFANVSTRTGALSPAVFNSLFAFAPDDPGVPYLTQFLYVQPLSERFVAAVGKARIVEEDDDDIFAGGQGVEQFSNLAFVDNPALLLKTPISSFFANAIMPAEFGSLEVFAIDPQDRTRQAFSRLGDLFSQGVILGGELTLDAAIGSQPGKHRFGGFWVHADLPDLRFTLDRPTYPQQPLRNSLATIDDSYTLYYNFDQYVKVYSDSPQRGWGVFGRLSLSDANPTPYRSFFSVGIGGYNPSRARAEDRFGLGWYFLDTSNQFGAIPQQLFGPRDGNALELFYNFQVTPWLNVTPDVQYIHPGASRLTGGDDAFVYGLRVNMKL